MIVTIKIHPLCKTEKYPSMVDLFREGDDIPIMSAHIDTIGDLLNNPPLNENKIYYDNLRTKKEVKLSITIQNG